MVLCVFTDWLVSCCSESLFGEKDTRTALNMAFSSYKECGGGAVGTFREQLFIDLLHESIVFAVKVFVSETFVLYSYAVAQNDSIHIRCYDCY